MRHPSTFFPLHRCATLAIVAIVLLAVPVPSRAQAEEEDTVPKKNFIVRLIDAFDEIDTNYVEPIDYNYTAMLQATRNLEYYTIGNVDYDSRVSFAERNNLRVGPYFGWRWLFLGYTFDVLHLGKKPKSRGINLDLSFYTSRVGLDLFYHRTGENFNFRQIHGMSDAIKVLEGEPCGNYISTQLIGLKAYYNFNSKRYSNQAIYSQSKLQRRSAGSFQLGVSFTQHDVLFNYQALPDPFVQEYGQEAFKALERVKYRDYAIHIGYAYNWVIARNWCLGMSLMPAISLTWTSTKTAMIQSLSVEDEEVSDDKPFYTKIYDSFRRQAALGLDFTARSGVIYNNGKWFAGISAIIHNFNYQRNDMRFSNTFGTANVFVGVYFQKRKAKTPRPSEPLSPTPVPKPVVEY